MQPSSTEEEFGDVLGRILTETRTSVRRLEALSSVSRRTVENWLHGPVRRPRHWEPVLRVAHALHLSAAQTDTLLRAAGLPPLAALQASTLTRGQAELLVLWHGPPLGHAPPPEASVAAPPNVPLPASWFIGRDEQLAKLTDLLRRPDVWLINVTGPGGIGKTRLAQEAARRLAGEYRHGAHFVPLETATTAAQLAEHLLAALAIRRSRTVSPEETILHYLRNRNALLVLDTLEHLTADLTLIGRIRRAAPDVKLLATSRSVLRLTGERVFVVPPLAMPPPEAARPGEESSDAVASDAVALFAARAREVDPDFALTATNTAEVDEICRLLGGLPLAIELAAAQTRVLSPRRIRARLAESTELLTGGPRDAPIRHRSIHETLAWSYNLLPPAEQALFRALGIFGDGCSMPAAEAVAPPESTRHGPFIDVLAALIDQSLLQVFRINGRRLYRMHEITRRFAGDQLADAGEVDATMRRLLGFLLDLAGRMNDQFRAPDRDHWIGRFEPESGHAWRVFEWGLATGDAAVVEDCLALSGALLQYWNTRGLHDPARRWTGRALAAARQLDIPPAAQGTALITAASMALIQTDVAESAAHAADALAAARAAGDTRLEVRARHLLGLCAFARDELDAAGEIWEEALRLAETIDAPSQLAAALDDLGNLAARRGEFERALALHRREQEVSLAAGDLYSEFYAVINLGEVSVNMGRPAAAEPYYRRALELCRAMGDSRGLAHVTLTQAALMFQLERPDEGRRLLFDVIRLSWEIQNLDITMQALAQLLAHSEAELPPATRARLGGALASLNERYASASLPVDDEAISDARAGLARQMDAAALALEWDIGRRLEWDEVVDLALEAEAAVESPDQNSNY